MSRTNAAKAAKPSEAKPPKGPNGYDFVARGMDRVNVEALVEAGKKYGDDAARELADLESGRHPLQRRKRTR